MNTINSIATEKAHDTYMGMMDKISNARSLFMDIMATAGYSEEEVIFMDYMWDQVMHSPQMDLHKLITKLSTPSFSKS